MSDMALLAVAATCQGLPLAVLRLEQQCCM